MKIDRSRVRKSTSEVPLECQQLIERLQQCSRTELLDELSRIHSWTFGKCELLHWAQVLDIFDRILGQAAERNEENKWILKCDTYNEQDFQLLIHILRFTSLLIEHSFSRHLYNSMEHLLGLLESNDMSVVLEVLNLLYMFSKRSNFITRLKPDEKECLLSRLQYLSENWGGKDNGFGLADCCDAEKEIPASATTLHVEFHREDELKSSKSEVKTQDTKLAKPNLHIIHIEHIDKLHKTPAEIMKQLVSLYYVPPEKEMWLFTHVRLATHFADYRNRLKSVQARLQALSVMVYSNAIEDSPSNLLYNGLLEELVEVVELQDPQLTDIRCAALRTLTAIIHLDRNPHIPNFMFSYFSRRPGSRLNSIIDVTGASQYHGFLPVLVRNCISSLTNQIDFGQTAFKKMKLQDEVTTALQDDSSCDSSKTATSSNTQDSKVSEAVVMDFDMEGSTQLQLSQMETKFPVSLTTALFSFLYHLASYEAGGEALVSCGMMESLLQVINWQGFELDHITFVTRAVRVIDLITNIDMAAFQTHGGLYSFINRLDTEVNFCNKDQLYQIKTNTSEHTFEDNTPGTSAVDKEEEPILIDLDYVADNAGKTCLPQRAALLKSMLNFLKKAFQDSTFAESIRHLMEGSLPNSLKNIIANAEYYGPSLFLLATDVVTVYVYQEPALLSALQDNGLTDVVLHSLLVKEVPATREVLGSLPNVFSALCLNNRGLESFAKFKPFEKLFNILLSPNYLPAMRRRRSSEPSTDTASNLGNAMDELMRHQPSLRQDATLAIIKLLDELVHLGTDPKYVCWRAHSKSEISPSVISRSNTGNTEGSSDEEEDDEEETSTSSQNAHSESQAQANSERTPIALIDYILNAMKFIDSILSNNSTDDHCREFVEKGGLIPLMKILGLPNLPVDCPATIPAQAVASVCKSILNLAHEPFLFAQGLNQLAGVLELLKPLYEKQEVPGGSKLLLELANATDIETAFSTASATPLLHAMGAAHGYVIMFVHICRTGQTEIRNLSLQHWGSEVGLKVLKGLANLYTSLVWESTLLLAYCSDDLLPSDCDFTREDIEKLNAFFDRCEGNSSLEPGGSTSMTSAALDVLGSNNPISMDLDGESSSSTTKPDRNLKYIKPLLGASSRLGRALAELFGLLVKLCVGSPIRQRRGQTIIAAPPIPSLYARNVATALNVLLAEGLDCDKLPPCPTAKCRLTFLICSVGFTSPMLFDERRYPYHLMLKKFVSLGGQTIFFKTFKWALTSGNLHSLEDIEYSNLPEGTIGFLDAWLSLLEKMVNPKAIFESPHTISNRPSHSYSFDPLKYLIQIHKLAFESVMLLWGKTPLASYGARTTETLLTILRHIFRGEKIIKEKMKADENKTESTNTSSSSGTAVTAAGSSTSSFRDLDDNLRQLVDMGFSREHAIEALLHSNNLEQATDYLLSNPPQLPRSGAAIAMEVESEDDQVMQAIAISLGCNSTTSDTKKDAAEEQDQSFESMITEFTYHALDVCLKLLEVLPETVHKVCELLVTIMKRNGRAYRDSLLGTLILEIQKCAASIYFVAFQGESNVMSYYTLAESKQAKKLTNYVHLFILFFEVSSYFEMKIPCGDCLNRSNMVEPMIDLVCKAIKMIIDLKASYEPKWLAPCFLLLDAVSKVATCTSRKQDMHKATNRVWRWYDLVTGKWAHYSNSNNKLINEAYWNGEQSIRVTCGRKRYTVTFASMLQMNDETGNNRPISMTLMTLTHPSCTDINRSDVETLHSKLTDKEEKRCTPIPGLKFELRKEIVKACVSLMHLPIEKNLLHSVLQICVRFTRDFEIAKVFVEEGGVKCLLKMRQINDFGGFGILATILIRHALEEPNTLKYAMEKVIRGRTLATIPPPYKDLVYLMRQIGGAVTRDPQAFFEVANSIIRVDITAAKGEPPESTLPLKVEPPSRTKAPPLEEPVSVEVISDLLEALLKPLEDDKAVDGSPEQEKSAEQEINADDISPSTNIQATETNDGGIEEAGFLRKNENNTKKPMLPKSVILKILADAVVSFGPIAKLITEYKYKPDESGIITEETSALAFIFDKILTGADNISDLDCATMCRMLIAALASSNHSPEAQITLVSEVKVALTRALYLPESLKKHSQVQNICGIISNMIDNCPLPHANRWTNCSINNIVKLMMRRGVFNDLAKITHYLDLSSPNTSFTANAALKPLESLSRTINQPAANSNNSKSRKSQQSTDDTANTHNATSAEGTNAHGEEIEDSENTDHDISGVVRSSLETNAVGGGELGNTLEEMMEHILDHRNNDSGQGYNDVPTTIGGNMEIDEECPLGYEDVRDAAEELMSTDSGESDSNPSDQVDDEGNDDNEGDDDNIDDTEENEDNNYDEDDNNEREIRREGGSGMFRIATATDRDEDILMIQYDADFENALPRMIRWNENGFAVPILDENNPNDHTAITHPLLMSRNTMDNNPSAISRNQRTNRPRRYQYLFSPRNPNPPVILQSIRRLLGPHDPHMANMMSANNLLSGPTEIRESARVVVMDNFGIIPSNEEQIDFVDQSGYLFGPSLAATLSHIPPVLHWWNIESKLLDLESVYDCTTYICNKLVPNLIKYRNEELRNKKVKDDEDNSKKRKQQKNDPENQDDYSPETVLFNYEQNKESEEDIDGVPLATTDTDPPNREEEDEDIDGVPIESSDTSNDRSESNTHNEDIILSPLQLSFVRGSSENSQSSIPETTHNAAVQTTENITRSADDSNSRAESEVRTESESSNPFELSLPSYIGSRCNIIFARPNQSPDRPEEESQSNSETGRTEFARSIAATAPNPLRAIFEEALNQQIDVIAEQAVEQTLYARREREEREARERDNEVNRDESTIPATSTENNSSATCAQDNSRGIESGEAINTEPSAVAGAAGPSTSNDDEIPEGVDPSFLEALPPEMRREVLEQHRILCIQQRIAANANNTTGEQQDEATISNEVSPEFLAALPPALQEEVLTQQRLEQQRQAAARANPNEPVDAGAFFETLQPSLRTMILSDMEDSQMSALPPDLAAEAQTLRRDWYARNRQMAQERFLQSNLGTIYRHSRGRQTYRPNNFQRGGWTQWSRDFMNNPVASNSPLKIKGRQLLDHEGLACLLVLLFTDDTHLNKLRLHRVIRNLCYHAPTREWIINALLSIIEKSVNIQPDDNLNKPARKGPRPGPLTSKLLTDAKHLQNGGNWLTIRMEAALGCAANVFIVNKLVGKKCDKSNGSTVISIHPQAAPIVCRNTLDLFTSLAKAFPSCLLPIKSIRDDTEKAPITPVKVKPDSSSDFWDVLLRLDSATKKGKSIQKTMCTSSSDSEGPIQFENTVFGKLLNMLASPVVNRNTQLTDNLLKLLSVTTSGMPELVKPSKSSKTKVQLADIANNPPTHALNLAVNVITYKNCSEEGLEFITNLLLNLANSSLDMSFIILNLLLNGAIEIGNIVEGQIHNMLRDLKDLINNAQKRKLDDGPSTSKGVICNRFTNEQVVITASSKVKTSCELQLPSMVPLTSKSSSQVFFLRVLRVIVQIRNSIKQNLKRESAVYELPALSEQLSSLSSFWETLSQCLSELEHAPDHHAVLVLQPAVEAFFLVHSPQQGPIKSKEKDTKEQEMEEINQESIETQNNSSATDTPAPTSARPNPEQSPKPATDAATLDFEKFSEVSTKTVVTLEQQQFLAFAEKHRTVLNQILRQSTAHLADGPFAVLVDHTRILDFDIKRRYFRTELERLDHGTRREETAVHVRRSNIFEDSFRELFRRPPEEWKNRFYIVFEDEEGQDAGGLLREWYVIISRDIFNPMYALFTVSPGDRVTYMINSASHYNSNHLCYYKFVGRVIAKAIYDNKLLECYFTRSFYKHILGISVKYTDMESEDYSFYRGLVYLMENNINNLGLDLTFSTEISEFGVTETRDLIPNGRHIPVTEENKMEYVRLVCQMKMTGAIKQQLNSFLEGFYDIIPMRLISIFNEQELELLISGLPNVDIDDLKANTEYHKYQTNSLQIQWFWRALRSFDQADRAKFLQFVTGTSKVPLQGFGALEGMNGVQKFQIHRDDRSTDRLPSAHTCFNQLDLPVYETYDKLRAYLLKAIHECSEGFGFA
ncbi:E3 ubiquitin-protein ligase HUWE1 isoform X1 [Diorhabda sublineata]|uniref:E3 ubiquitin-protein ligase HUWE1 isoform X1 n=1 Tax=Diorhabda sublineata TaxID=1163346 RepID=UPI0024E060E8|nr:E3 ubiquitin-protein ligase HUWE1 isoform X1 [Diorhabda sublineata]XP_056645576.1 E3 ubiquitin-protein ligase HUWE1 isoform X1 [Diorhabda sublineata]